MAWIDSNDYLLIVATAKDRIDSLLSSTAIAIETKATSDRRRPPEPAHLCDVPGCALVHLPV